MIVSPSASIAFGRVIGAIVEDSLISTIFGSVELNCGASSTGFILNVAVFISVQASPSNARQVKLTSVLLFSAGV